MKKKKRWVLAGIIMLAFVVVGCGKKTQGNQRDQENITKLTWYMAGDPSKDHEKVVAEANKYLREKLKAEVEIKMIGFGDYEKKMQVIISSGEAYDISYVSNYVTNAHKGAYLDLTEYLDTRLKPAADRLADGYIKGASIDGKLMAFPINGAIASAEYWVFPEEYVKENGLNLENVQGLETLEPVLKEFKSKNTSVTPLGIGAGFKVGVPYDLILGDGLPFGVALEGDTTKIVNVYQSQEMQAALETMLDYYESGYIMKDAATAVDDPFPLKKDNKNWLIRRQTSGYDGTSGIESITGFPVIAKRVTPEGIKTTSSATVALQAISANSKHKEKAIDVLNLVNSDPKLANILANGIEGEHYESNEDGSITFLDKKQDYALGGWQFTDYNLQKVAKLQTSEQRAEQERFIADAKESPALGFAVDTQPIRTEIASIQGVMDQYLASLNTGTVDPNTKLSEMQEKLENAGIKKAMDEIQTQYSEWLKTAK